MNLNMSLSQTGRALAVIAGAACLLTSALATDRVFQPVKRFQVARGARTSTSTVQPQIQPMTTPRYQISENEPVEPPYNDLPNNLVPGGLMTRTRGSGPKITFPGPGYTGFFPPDCDMGVGPNHVVAAVNTRISFFNKSNGQKTFEQDMDNNGFFSGVGGASEVYSDPKVFYDKLSSRWFVFIIEVNGFGGGTQKSRVLLAVSDDNNPNGNWNKYSIDTLVTSGGNVTWLDYPMVGMNKDAIAIGGNNFGFSGGFVATVFIIPKAPLLTGGTATVTTFTDPAGNSIQPQRSWDPTSNKIFLVSRGNGATMKLYAVTNILGTPAMTQTTVNVPPFQGSTNAVTLGGGSLDTLGSRVFTTSYRAGKLAAAHTVKPGSGSGPNRVRWYQFAVNNWPTSGSPTLIQSGEVAGPNGVETHMPAIAENVFGDISILYSLSSGSIAADLMRTARTTADPLGQMGLPIKIKGSAGSYSVGRWGDYFACAVDPVDDSTFWGFGMNITSNGAWDTTVSSWTVSTGGTGGGTVVDVDAITTILGSYIVGDGPSVQTVNNVYYQIGSVANPQLGQAAGAEMTFPVPADTDSIKFRAVATGNAAGGTMMVYGWDNTSNQYVLIGSQPMRTSGVSPQTVNFPSTNLARFIDGTGHVKVMARVHIPRRPFGGLPSPFTYRIDQAQLLITQAP